MNGLPDMADWLPVPCPLTLDELAYSEEHLNDRKIQSYRKALRATKLFWMESNSRSRLLQTTFTLAAIGNQSIGLSLLFWRP